MIVVKINDFKRFCAPVFITFLVTVLLLLMGPTAAAADPPEPTYDTAVVDADPGEWDLSKISSPICT